MNMNKTILGGRVAKDPTFYKGETKKSDRLIFTLMVNRPKSEKADAITIVAWDKSARAGAEHITKGKTLLISGRIATYFDAEKGQNFVQVNAESVEYGPYTKAQQAARVVGEEDTDTDKLAAKLAARTKETSTTSSPTLIEKKMELIENLVEKHNLTFADAKKTADEWAATQKNKMSAATSGKATVAGNTQVPTEQTPETETPF